MLSFTIPQVTRAQQLATNMAQTEQRAEVLLLASYDDSDSATQMQRDGVMDLLERSSVAIDVEYLDVHECVTSMNLCDAAGYEQIGAKAYAQALISSAWGKALAQKLQEHGPYSAVICIDDDALYYAEGLHEDIFPQTPVVFVGVNDVSHAQRVFNDGYATGLTENNDVSLMVGTAERMCPEATHLLVLTDGTATGVGNRAQFEQNASKATDLPIDYVDSSSLSRAELGKKVSLVEDDAILVYLDACSDITGNAYSASQTAYFISQAATQPVFAVGFGGVGEGYLASGFVDHEKAGMRAGELTIMVLNGTRPADIPLEEFSSDGLVFDSRALADHGIAASALPANATMLNQNGFSLDLLRPIFLPMTLLVLGIACIVAFAILGYRRTANEVAEIVTQRNMLEQRFYTDHLTDMPNMQWLTAYAASDASAQVRSIVEITVPEMEEMDATRGAGTANELVKALAVRLDGLDKLFLVRPAQDEFILGIDHELKPGGTILDKLEYLLSQPIAVGKESVVISPCIGVFNREHGMSIEEMVAGVDIAIRQAEQLGMGGEVIFYDDDLRRAVEHKLEITSYLKEAIDNEDLIVVYQPQISVKTNEVVGYEALVRMRGDLYPPEQFIPVAEMNGQIVDVDRIVTRKVVQQLATWKKRKQRMRPVSINYSSGQLRDDHYIAYVVALLDEYGVSRDMLRMDIKEKLFINNMAKASDFVEELRMAGFAFAIDDFGAGYTSISRVMQIPADVVKIDRSLTAAFSAHGDEGVIANLVRLVHGAKKIVVIEGIETVEQFQMCREVGCDVAQGFYFTEPLLPEQAVRYKPPVVPVVSEGSERAMEQSDVLLDDVERPSLSSDAIKSDNLLGDVRSDDGQYGIQVGNETAD